MNVLLSIIIPVYKVEAYLKACIDSIIAQSFTDFELILVDDGSPDKCDMICDEYAEKDSRIKVIHKTNGGLSSARNAGIEVAKGQYITFVDSDDEVSPGTYSPNMEILKNDPSIDMLMYPVHVHCNSTSGYIIHGNNTHSEGEKNIINSWVLNKGHYHPYAVNKIFKTKLFDHIKYPTGRKFEDLLTIIPLLKECKHTYTSDKGCYLYYQRSTSICNDIPDYSSICDLMDGKMLVLKELRKHNNLNKEMLKFYLYAVNTLIDVNRHRGKEKDYYNRLLEDLSSTQISLGALFKLPTPFINKIKNLSLALFGIRIHCYLYKFIHR